MRSVCGEKHTHATRFGTLLSFLLLISAAFMIYSSVAVARLQPSDEEEGVKIETRTKGDPKLAAAAERKGSWPFKGSSVRGFQEKRGVPPPEYYGHALSPQRRGLFDEWMHNYINGTQTGEGPSIPFPHCTIAVNHHYKFIWIRGYKVGTTSMRRPLGYLCEDNWATPKDADLSRCSTEIHHHKDLSPETVATWWKEYFVFGVVRNPYTHFASAEQFIGHTMGGRCDRPSFLEVCQEPFLHAKICARDHCCPTAHHYYHFRHQSDCLFDRNFNIVVDFLAETENLEEDFGTIVDEINKRRDPSLPPLGGKELEHKNVKKTTGSPEGHGYSYDLYKQNQTCLKSISEFFKRDFDLLGYATLDHLD